MSILHQKKIAIVHEWFDKYAGSERVVEQLVEIFPSADIFALVDFLPPEDKGFIKHKDVKTTFIQKLPFARRNFRKYLPLFPLAVEQIDLRNYDIIISSSHAVTKGVLTHPGQLHICYCHSPMRYAWDLYFQYMHESKLTTGIKGFLFKSLMHYLRNWDYISSGRVNHYVANSNYISKRIKNAYSKESSVIYPPVDTLHFQLNENKSDFYFVASRMVPYKKLDIIAEAFTNMPHRKLIIAGEGEELKKIKNKSASNIQIVPPLSRQEFLTHIGKARAFVFAAEEDFGIVIAEAQACGTPVIAFKKGGAAEIVIDGKTGVLFDEQTPASITAAVERFELISPEFNPSEIKKNAERFSIQKFKTEMEALITKQAEIFF